MKDRIKKIRKELDLTQQKFADRLGVKRNTVGQWECGINSLTEQTINSICREFNINEEWLRTGEGDMYRKRTRNQELQAFINDVMEDVDESFRKRLILALARMDESEWEVLLKLSEELAKKED